MRPYLRFCLDAEKCFTAIAGVDEAGCGPLAGDVFAAAVILDPARPIRGLKDCKQLDPAQRERLDRAIRRRAVAFALGRADVDEIDRLNILQARLLAMQRAVRALGRLPEFIYVDGNRCPQWPYVSKAVVGGDNKIRSIAAASVLAKVARDRTLVDIDRRYPGYGFARHKGYSTREHLDALKRLGPSPVHRKSFAPVAALLATPP